MRDVSSKKRVPSLNCAKCGKPFRRTNPLEDLCGKCRAVLPTCASCKIVMAPEYGYSEGFGRIVGKYKICSGCNYELQKKGYLHIGRAKKDVFLLLNGRVRLRK